MTNGAEHSSARTDAPDERKIGRGKASRGCAGRRRLPVEDHSDPKSDRRREVRRRRAPAAVDRTSRRSRSSRAGCPERTYPTGAAAWKTQARARHLKSAAAAVSARRQPASRVRQVRRRVATPRSNPDDDEEDDPDAGRRSFGAGSLLCDGSAGGVSGARSGASSMPLTASRIRDRLPLRMLTNSTMARPAITATMTMTRMIFAALVHRRLSGASLSSA